MSNDDEIQSHLTDGDPGHSNMDDAFCARMHAAIAAGLKNGPIGVVTTPGTKTPKYLATEPRPLVSSQRAARLRRCARLLLLYPLNWDFNCRSHFPSGGSLHWRGFALDPLRRCRLGCCLAWLAAFGRVPSSQFCAFRRF